LENTFRHHPFRPASLAAVWLDRSFSHNVSDDAVLHVRTLHLSKSFDKLGTGRVRKGAVASSHWTYWSPFSPCAIL